MYQSFKLLRGAQRASPSLWPQDYLDDLESFFYVLSHVCFLYNGGRHIKNFATDHRLADWNDGRPDFKWTFITMPEPLLSSYIKKSNCYPAFHDLFTNLQNMFIPVLKFVAEVSARPSAPTKPVAYKEYKSSAEKSYCEFLGHVDAAINHIEQIQNNPTATTTMPAAPSLLLIILGSAWSPSSALLPVTLPPPSAYPSSSSSQSSKRRLSTTSLQDAEQDKAEAGGGDHDAGHEVYLRSEASDRTDRKRVKGG